MNVQTAARSSAIYGRLDKNGPVGFIDVAIILAIIQIVLPLIIDCFDPDDGAETVQYVKARHGSSGYDKRLVKAVTRQVKRAARKETRLTWDQANEIAIATLDDIRLGDEQQASLVIRECA